MVGEEKVQGCGERPEGYARKRLVSIGTHPRGERYHVTEAVAPGASGDVAPAGTYRGTMAGGR